MSPNKSIVINRTAEALCGFLVAAAFATIQVLIGGTRLLFSLPAYGFLAFAGLISLFLLRRAKPEPSQLCLVTTAIFLGYILARGLLSPVSYLARSDIYSVLGGLLIYFFIACVFTDSKRRIMLVAFLLLIALVHVFIGAIQFRDGSNFMLISFLQRTDYGRRASGFYVCPNHLAGLLEVLGAFGLAILFWSRWPTWAKLLIGYATCICYAGIVLTASRGGYLSTAASLLVFGILSLVLLRKASPGLFWKIGGPAIIAAIFLSVALVFVVKKSEFISGRAQNVFETQNVRIDFWKAAIQQWKQQPVFGTGSGTYLYYGRQFRTERVQVDPVYVHNDYLQLLSDYGLVGVVLFAFFLGAHLRAAWKNLSRLGFKRVGISSRLLSNSMALQLGAVTALAAYMVHSVFDFNLHIPGNVLLLAFAFGIIANAGIRREPNPESVGLMSFVWRLFPALIGVVLAIQCVRLLPGEYFTERARTSLRDNHPLAGILFALRGLACEKNNPSLYQYLGSAHIEQAKRMSDPQARDSFYRAAIAAYDKGRALAPRDKIFAQGAAYAYDALGRFEEAEWMFTEALALDPKSTPTKHFYETHLEQWKTAGATAKP